MESAAAEGSLVGQLHLYCNLHKAEERQGSHEEEAEEPPRSPVQFPPKFSLNLPKFP